MARRAHWATVAATIRRKYDLSWTEARAVYRQLLSHTRETRGHRPGLVDIKRSHRLVEKARVEVHPPSLQERLTARGMEGARWHTQSLIFERAGVDQKDIIRLSQLLTKGQNQIQKNGAIASRTKGAIRQLMSDLVARYPSLSVSDYFAITRKLYGLPN